MMLQFSLKSLVAAGPSSVEDDGEGSGGVTTCTKNNQHLVIGPLSMLHQVWQDETVRVCRRVPDMSNSLFLTCLAAIRYDPLVRVFSAMSQTCDLCANGRALCHHSGNE